MLITNFTEKVEVIARYRTASIKLPPTLINAAGRPTKIEVQLEGTMYEFHLDGSEMEKLLAKFSVPSVQKLFGS